MSDTDHTPGPWTKGSTAAGYTAIDVAGDDEAIAWVDFRNPADLRLALAAPEMLKELQRLYMKYGHKYTIDVIAKATGKQL